MICVTQGTIQVKRSVDQTKNEVFEAFITPVPDYHVKHRGKDNRDTDYTILIEKNDGKAALARTAEEEYGVEDYVKEVLTEAASRSITVEVEVWFEPGDPQANPPVAATYKIVAVKTPATVPKPR